MLKFTKKLCITLVIVLIVSIIAPFGAFAAEVPSQPIKSVTHEVIGDNVIFTVTTAAGDFNRIRCGLSTSIKDNLETVDSYTVNADGDYVWKIKTPAPIKDTTLVFDLRSAETNKYVKDYFYYDFPTDSGELIDGWYTSEDGGFKFYVEDWILFNQYSLTLVETLDIPTNGCTIADYTAEDDETFNNKTWADFKNVLNEDYTIFEKTTVGNAEYTMYYAQTTNYECYVFQANGKKYFINFIYGNVGTRQELAAFAARAMESIVITNDVEPPAIKSVDYKISGEKITFTVTTRPGNFNRIRCGLTTSVVSTLRTFDSYTVNADGDYVWRFITTAPTEDTQYVFDLRDAQTNKYVKDYFYFDIKFTDKSDYNTIVDSYYISADGGFKFFVDDWYMPLEDLSYIVPPSDEEVITKSGFLVTIRDSFGDETFEKMTQEDFEIYLGYEVESVTKTTIADTDCTIYYVACNDHSGYYFFQANGVCYAIQICCINSTKDEAMALAATIKDTIVIL